MKVFFALSYLVAALSTLAAAIKGCHPVPNNAPCVNGVHQYGGKEFNNTCNIILSNVYGQAIGRHAVNLTFTGCVQDCTYNKFCDYVNYTYCNGGCQLYAHISGDPYAAYNQTKSSARGNEAVASSFLVSSS